MYIQVVAFAKKKWTAIKNIVFLQSQVAVLSKFLHAAQLCKEMRNYATCLAIADGLENIIIKQLPAWKNLPTKSYAVMEDLKSVRVWIN